MGDQDHDRGKGGLAGAAAGMLAGLSPTNSLLFMLALAVAAFAGWNWLRMGGDPRPSFPYYGVLAVSFAGGFLIGRVLRRVAKTAAVVAALLIGVFSLASFVVDTSKAREAVTAGAGWVQSKTGEASDYLVHLLPSGGAAGAGAFMGAGRKRKKDDDGGEHRG